MQIKDIKHWERQTKDSWLEQVKKDNPFIGNSEYFRTIDESILAKSLAFTTDIKHEGHVIKSTGEENFCKVGIKLNYEDAGILKSALNIALDNGAEFIHFVLSKNINEKSIQILIENVYLDMLATKWTFPTTDLMIYCEKLIKQKFGNVNAFYICNDSSSIQNTFIEIQTSLYSFTPFHSASWAKTIAKMLKELSSTSKLTAKIIFEICFNNDFFINICSVRALKLALNKIWKIYDLKAEPFFEANIDENALTQDVHSNIYKLAAMALSASVSGVDFLILPPADIKTDASDFRWLITSLHTQHILKQEAHLIKLIDPTAGSYFIEDLTEQIAEKLWLDLQENIRND